MCRNITILRGLEPPASPAEIEAAARQYVRKVSGMTKPSAANEARFEEAVQGCMREEIVRLCSLPDFRRWSEMQEREAEPRVSR